MSRIEMEETETEMRPDLLTPIDAELTMENREFKGEKEEKCVVRGRHEFMKLICCYLIELMKSDKRRKKRR